MKLTKKVIDAVMYEGGGGSRHVLWDAEVSGLGLRVYPSQRKSFVLSYRNESGRKRLLTLGAYGVLTLSQARQMAREKLVGVVQGEDPVAKRKQAHEDMTFRELSEVYMKRHAKPHKRSWKEDERYLNYDILPAIGSLKALAVTYEDVDTMHRKKGEGATYAANRIMELVRGIYNWARKKRVIPYAHPNPAAGIERFKEAKRERFVEPSELPALVEAIGGLRNVYVKGALWMYLLTGLRKTALLRATWARLDRERATLYIPEEDSKNGVAFWIPLSAQALAILDALPREVGNLYIFCSPTPGTHLKKIRNSWLKVRKEAGLEDVRMHDLRRTVGSWMAMDGVPLLVIGKTLGHTSTAATQVYARMNQDPVRKALDAHGERIMKAVGAQPASSCSEVD